MTNVQRQQSQEKHDAYLSAYFPWDDDKPESTCGMIAKFYNEHGYAVITGHAPAHAISSLRQAAQEILQNFHDSSQQASFFSCDNATRALSDKRFLDSAADVTCFLEEQQEQGTLPAVNKIGHAMHDTHPVFRQFSRAPRVKAIAHAIGFDHHPNLVQSMYILKNPRVGAVVTPHRDVTFVTPASENSDDCVGFWWALQSATLQNGCLYVVPGSHKDGRKQRRFVRKNDSLSFHDDTVDAVDHYDDQNYLPLPVEPGDLVLLHGAIVHKSSHNYSNDSRHAYTIHLVRGPLTPTCWLQRPDRLPFRPL